MKEMYIMPQADVICFAPVVPVAADLDPTWGFEPDIFNSNTEPQNLADFGANN